MALLPMKRLAAFNWPPLVTVNWFPLGLMVPELPTPTAKFAEQFNKIGAGYQHAVVRRGRARAEIDSLGDHLCAVLDSHTVKRTQIANADSGAAPSAVCQSVPVRPRRPDFVQTTLLPTRVSVPAVSVTCAPLEIIRELFGAPPPITIRGEPIKFHVVLESVTVITLSGRPGPHARSQLYARHLRPRGNGQRVTRAASPTYR